MTRWSGTWKQYEYKMDNKHIRGSSMWIDPSIWAKNVKIFASHGSAHQKTTKAEDFNDYVDRKSIVHKAIDLFLQPPLSLCNGLMNKVAMVAGMQVIDGLSIMAFHSARLMYLKILLSAPCDSSKDQDWAPQYGMTSLWPAGKFIILNYFHLGKGSILCLLRQTLIPVIDLPSLHIMFLSKPPSMNTQNTFPSIVAFHTALLTPRKMFHGQKSEAMDSHLWNSLASQCYSPL